MWRAVLRAGARLWASCGTTRPAWALSALRAVVEPSLRAAVDEAWARILAAAGRAGRIEPAVVVLPDATFTLRADDPAPVASTAVLAFAWHGDRLDPAVAELRAGVFSDGTELFLCARERGVGWRTDPPVPPALLARRYLPLVPRDGRLRRAEAALAEARELRWLLGDA